MCIFCLAEKLGVDVDAVCGAVRALMQLLIEAAKHMVRVLNPPLLLTSSP